MKEMLAHLTLCGVLSPLLLASSPPSLAKERQPMRPRGLRGGATMSVKASLYLGLLSPNRSEEGWGEESPGGWPC